MANRFTKLIVPAAVSGHENSLHYIWKLTDCQIYDETAISSQACDRSPDGTNAGDVLTRGSDLLLDHGIQDEKTVEPDDPRGKFDNSGARSEGKIRQIASLTSNRDLPYSLWSSSAS